MLVRERAQRHGLTLAVDIGEGLAEWVADERKLKQSVVNLLSNAVKFTPAGGSVTLRARHLNGLSGRSGDWAEVSVIDTGVGIKPEDQALVFEEFRQASGDVLRKSEGTGLGLALVKRFVELHGGQIVLASAPGQGSTFTITLPQHELKVLQ
jgi:signal transduction histidine kinase